MNPFIFSLRVALEDFRRNKLRTFLTSLGIMIGVSSVVLLISFGLGLKAYINQQFESLGTNLIYLMPGDIEAGFGGGFQQSMMSGIRFDNRDLTAISRVRRIKTTVPFFSKIAKIKGAKDASIYEISASTAKVFQIMNVEAEYGDLWTKTDEDKGSKKIVIGPNIAKKIFGSPEAAVSKKAVIENVSFTVVGVAKSKGGGGGLGQSLDDQAYIPFKSAASFNADKKYQAIVLQAETQDDIPVIKAEVREALEKRYNPDQFSIVEQTEILSTVTSIFGILNLVLVSIAAISLIVGGIGIMNIMFVSVVERIREIGIRRAIGARKHDILFQFLAEAVLLSVAGGGMAILISVGVVALIRNVFPAYIDVMTVIVALGVSSAVGIVFGVAPAKRAADLSPIDAIRYE